MTLSVLNIFSDKDCIDNRIVNFSVLLGKMLYNTRIKRDHDGSARRRV